MLIKSSKLTRLLGVFFLLFLPCLGYASVARHTASLKMTTSALGIISLIIFCLAYVLVMIEEFIHLKKSKPVLFVSGAIWILVATAAYGKGQQVLLNQVLNHNLLEYANLLLFLLVAMTYVNSMEERLVFAKLRSWLLAQQFSYRQLFWVTGVLAFVISPIADNLTTALVMCAVVTAVGVDSPRFVAVACVNIVIAANAGGAFSPFGDITTLMVWQSGQLNFLQFFHLFIPSIVNYVIPAGFMHFAIPRMTPHAKHANVRLKRGARRIILLFLITIFTTVALHYLLHLPPTIGMMSGLSMLMLFSAYLHKSIKKGSQGIVCLGAVDHLNIFRQIERAEWDTLLFFYGIILCVGGLALFGYLELGSSLLYGKLGAWLPPAYSATPANIIVGLISAVLDNIPVMFAVLGMQPALSDGQWLLVTLTAGVGGSLLATGSAAGVALLGQAKGDYTFFKHLKWTWAIFLGYVASIACQMLLNAKLYT